MLSSDEGEIDLFFDTTDCLSSEESVVAEEVGSVQLDYGIWMNEPLSVRERRESFLRGMGLAEFASLKICSEENAMVVAGSTEMTGLERLTQCSGAVSSSCISSSDLAADNSERRARQSNACSDGLEGKQEDRETQKVVIDGEGTRLSTSPQEYVENDVNAHLQEYKNLDAAKEKLKHWLKRFVNKRKGRGDTFVHKVSKSSSGTHKIDRMKVSQHKKSYMEFSALYNGQEIRAHKGLIWTMKFSPDGKYLASGGEDGVVCIWRVMSQDASCNYSPVERDFDTMNGGKSTFGGKKTSHASVVIPEKVLHIEESPLQEFHGHSSDVLDLSWSHSNFLLSSSKDKTVRLWQYVNILVSIYVSPLSAEPVTCIQFNPVDDNYFITGSIDGKVRIWGVSEKRVVDWADVRDVITAICYQPDGSGFIVGSITGTCRFYDASGKHLKRDAQIRIQGRKRNSAKKITGIQFSQEVSQRVMIASEDSKLHIFDGIDAVNRYRGLPKSGGQMSASFTSSGRHIISVGEDSRVYLWNHNEPCIPSSRKTKSVRSCEHFFSEGVTVAIPWSSGMGAGQRGSWSSSHECSQALNHMNATPLTRDSERFSLSNWFSMDGSCKVSATWPEEKLPLLDVPASEDESICQHHSNAHKHIALSDMWGLVIVTAGLDGTIRTFHNYGLPIRL
ncbi:putative WD repeat-containing protein C3H5.08c [Morella rubra]|uniref:Putative WD repeat-containing protein C3H5.08c n=1 Tax=Morella rubra TaxID=262757 RepID=A0A6A1VDP5_9ROSI|nr:putative WD repeat-containing protein C3H5.08c [Morella rubra]